VSISTKITEGIVFLTIAKIALALAALVVQLSLTRILTQEQFGKYSVVISVVLNVMLIFGTGPYLAISKNIAQSDKTVSLFKNIGYSIQFSSGLIISLIYLALTPLIALLLNDITLRTPLMITTVMIIPYAVFAILTGFLNGQKKYRMQSLIQIGYAVTQAIFIPLGAYLLVSEIGGILGYIVAIIIPCCLGVVYLKFTIPKDRRTFINYLKFLAPLILYSYLINNVITFDLYFIKAMTVPELADQQSAIYSASAIISKFVFFILTAIISAMLPIFSRTMHDKDQAETQKASSMALKYTLIIILPIVSIFGVLRKQLLLFLFPDSYLPGAQILAILPIGLFLFGLFMYCNSLFISNGNSKIPLIMSVVILSLAGLLNYFLVQSLGILGAALSTTLASLVGAGVSLILIKRSFEIVFPYMVFLKVTLMCALFWLGELFLHFFNDTVALFTYPIIALIVYISLLLVTKTITKKEIGSIFSSLKS
jgi:O-antigen/teichoic acid export membrane protein